MRTNHTAAVATSLLVCVSMTPCRSVLREPLAPYKLPLLGAGRITNYAWVAGDKILTVEGSFEEDTGFSISRLDGRSLSSSIIHGRTKKPNRWQVANMSSFRDQVVGFNSEWPTKMTFVSSSPDGRWLLWNRWTSDIIVSGDLKFVGSVQTKHWTGRYKCEWVVTDVAGQERYSTAGTIANSHSQGAAWTSGSTWIEYDDDGAPKSIQARALTHGIAKLNNSPSMLPCWGVVIGANRAGHLLVADSGGSYIYPKSLTIKECVVGKQPSAHTIGSVSFDSESLQPSAALSPDRKRIAWLIPFCERQVAPQSGANGPESEEFKSRVYVSDADGKNLHVVARPAIPRSMGRFHFMEFRPPTNLLWKPDGKAVTFLHNGEVWFVPIS